MPGALLVCVFLQVAAFGATRPQYGGTLRVEVRQNAETPDPPPLVGGGFTIARWEAGRRAVYEADENAAGGRPFWTASKFNWGARCATRRAIWNWARRTWWNLVPTNCGARRRARVWSSSPVRVLALVFGPRVDDARVREALALAVDRSAIHSVLLQRQGEVSGALLPQWLSGYAFLFPAAADLGRARQLAAGARPITLGVSDAALRPIAERIALNARDAGLRVSVTPQPANADVRAGGIADRVGGPGEGAGRAGGVARAAGRRRDSAEHRPSRRTRRSARCWRASA